MEITKLEEKTKKTDGSIEVKYLDREKPNFVTNHRDMSRMFGLGRFIKNE